MGQMCIGCSPQLIEGICPDSAAGRQVAELAGVLREVFADNAAVNRLSWRDKAAAAIAKVREHDPSYVRNDDTANP
jgi:hypothetical protein